MLPLPRRPISLPRIRGGVSSPPSYLQDSAKSSPHTRGCFPTASRAPVSTKVFPAYAGVFLDPVSYPHLDLGLPRIRGGVSQAIQLQVETN